MERERAEFGFKGWLDAGTSAKDRETWRERLQGPSSHKGKSINDTILYYYFAVCCMSCWRWHDLPCSLSSHLVTG